MLIDRALHGAFVALIASVACTSNEDSSPKGGAGGNGGTASDSGGNGATNGDCSVTLAPSNDDLGTIQGALDTDVKSGDTVCFSPGTYHLQNHVTLGSAANVTFRGTGATRDNVVLDFAGQTAGEEGVLVTTDNFTIENLSIENTAGNGIKVQAAYSIFRNIKVGWDVTTGGPDGGPASGAYAIYPTTCDHTLMEDNEVYGASDAGIYAGQCKHVIARRNHAHGNVLGIEIENTLAADVYENDVHDNTTGMLLDLLPHLQQKEASDYLVHDNNIHDNNLPNFAEQNTLAATAPQGTGVLILAPKNVELTANQISGNDGVAVIIISYDLVDIINSLSGAMVEAPDPDTSRWPTNLFIHDNTYSNNGTDPQGAYAVFVTGTDGGAATIPYDVLWDGVLSPDTPDDAAAMICLGTPEQQSFLNFHGTSVAALTDPSVRTTDTSAHQCTLPAIAPLTP